MAARPQRPASYFGTRFLVVCFWEGHFEIQMRRRFVIILISFMEMIKDHDPIWVPVRRMEFSLVLEPARRVMARTSAMMCHKEITVLCVCVCHLLSMRVDVGSRTWHSHHIDDAMAERKSVGNVRSHFG